MDFENEYSIVQARDSKGELYDKKLYKKDVCCTKFEFNDSVSPEDKSFSHLIQHFEKTENVGEKTNHYIIIEGEKND